jgi:hypothetical protein
MSLARYRKARLLSLALYHAAQMMNLALYLDGLGQSH